VADLTHLDLKQLQSFRDHEVDNALAGARRHRNDNNDGIRPLGDLIDGHTTAQNLDKSQQLLHVGHMATGDLVSGPALIEDVKSVATSIDKLLGDQEKLFEDLMEALQDTIDKMNKTNQDNLDSIDAQTLLQIFEDVDTDISGQGAGSAAADGSDAGSGDAGTDGSDS